MIMTPEKLQETMKDIHMAKVEHAAGYLEQHALDVAIAALLQIEHRLNKQAGEKVQR